MDLGLHGTVVLVTGGSKGIGLASKRAGYVSGAVVSVDGAVTPMVV